MSQQTPTTTVVAAARDVTKIYGTGETEVRALMHRGPDGAYDGFRLSKISRGSTAERLGLKNGDVLHRVDDQPLFTASGLEAGLATAFSTPGAHTFTLTRRAQVEELGFEVEAGACPD